MNEKVYLSQEGKRDLEEQLRKLVEERPLVVERLKTAREFGDLSENAEYAAAKDELARISGEIERIEKQLKVAVIYIAGADKSVVSLGKTIKIYDHDMDEEAVYKIVGTAEADIYKNKISNDSAVGRALLGKKIGETVTVEAPGGGYQITIKEIID